MEKEREAQIAKDNSPRERARIMRKNNALMMKMDKERNAKIKEREDNLEAMHKKYGTIIDADYSELSPEEKKARKEYYEYTYERKKNDINGNPRHYITVYKLTKNTPELIVKNEDVGYRDPRQAVEDVIQTNKGWKKDYAFSSGYSENQARRLRRLGKIIINQV